MSGEAKVGGWIGLRLKVTAVMLNHYVNALYHSLLQGLNDLPPPTRVGPNTSVKGKGTSLI